MDNNLMSEGADLVTWRETSIGPLKPWNPRFWVGKRTSQSPHQWAKRCLKRSTNRLLSGRVNPERLRREPLRRESDFHLPEKPHLPQQPRNWRPEDHLGHGLVHFDRHLHQGETCPEWHVLWNSPPRSGRPSPSSETTTSLVWRALRSFLTLLTDSSSLLKLSSRFWERMTWPKTCSGGGNKEGKNRFFFFSFFSFQLMFTQSCSHLASGEWGSSTMNVWSPRNSVTRGPCRMSLAEIALGCFLAVKEVMVGNQRRGLGPDHAQSKTRRHQGLLQTWKKWSTRAKPAFVRTV